MWLLSVCQTQLREASGTHAWAISNRSKKMETRRLCTIMWILQCRSFLIGTWWVGNNISPITQKRAISFTRFPVVKWNHALKKRPTSDLITSWLAINSPQCQMGLKWSGFKTSMSKAQSLNGSSVSQESRCKQKPLGWWGKQWLIFRTNQNSNEYFVYFGINWAI